MSLDIQEVAAKIIVALSLCFTLYFFYKEINEDLNG